jgi:hypothetical protein
MKTPVSGILTLVALLAGTAGAVTACLTNPASSPDQSSSSGGVALTTLTPSVTTTSNSGDTAGDGFYTDSTSLNAVAGGALVAVVSDATEIEVVSGDHSLWEATIEELLFVVDWEAAPNANPARELDLPPLRVGDRVRLREDLGPGADEFDFALPKGRVLVSGSWWSAFHQPGEAPWFGINAIATVAEDGSLTFLHRRFAERLNEDLVRARAETDWPDTDAELMAAWAAEKWFYADTNSRGPITEAFLGERTQPSFLERWQALDPKVRMLDPELTPPEILETLVAIPVLIQVPEAAAGSGRMIVIRTDLGVIHASYLNPPGYPAHFLAPPDSTWEILIADIDGADEVLVARITPDVWMTAVDGDRLLITLSGETVTNPIYYGDDPVGIVTPLRDGDYI